MAALLLRSSQTKNEPVPFSYSVVRSAGDLLASGPDCADLISLYLVVAAAVQDCRSYDRPLVQTRQRYSLVPVSDVFEGMMSSGDRLVRSSPFVLIAA